VQVKAGELNWGSPWNRQLRSRLLAPPGGFQGAGLRATLGAASLSVQPSWRPSSAAEGAPAAALLACRASNVVQLHAVVAAAAQGGAALASLGLTPLALRLSGEQLAALACIAGGVAGEVQGRPPAPSEGGTAGTAYGGEGHWLQSASLDLDVVHAAYSSAGQLASWAAEGGAAPPPTRDEATVYLGCGSAALAARAGSGAACAVAARLQLLQPHAWAREGAWYAGVPAVEAGLESLDGRAEPSSPGGGSAAEPLLLLTGLTVSTGVGGSGQPPSAPADNGGVCVAQQSVALALTPGGFAALCTLLQLAAAAPALPWKQHARAAPAAAAGGAAAAVPSSAGSGASQVYATLGSLLWSVEPIEGGQGLAGRIVDLSLSQSPVGAGTSSQGSRQHVALGLAHVILTGRQAGGPTALSVLR
jgi:hypothetical protein